MAEPHTTPDAASHAVSATDGGAASLKPAQRALVWARAHRLLAGSIGGSLLAAAGGLAFWCWSVATRETPTPQQQLEAAFHALADGDDAQAAQLAAELQAARTLALDDAWAPAFILGAVADHLAQKAWDGRRASLYKLSAARLEQARDMGLPDDVRPECLYLLGKNLLLSGSPGAARTVLAEALESGGERTSELHHLASRACLEQTTPLLAEALEHNARYLADANLPAADRERALVERSQIQLRLDDVTAARATLAQLPDRPELAAEIALVQAQLLLAEVSAMPSAEAAEQAAAPDQQAAEKLRQAIKLLREAQRQDTLRNQVASRASYLTGVCYRRLGDEAASREQFARTAKLYPGTPESLAAQFELAESLRGAAQDAEAVEAYRSVLGQLDGRSEYRNPWLGIESLRRRTLAAYEEFRQRLRFAAAAEVARRIAPLFSPAQSIEYVAQAQRDWGKVLQAEAETAPVAESADLLEQARQQYRHAARGYLNLARERETTRDYPDDLWKAADAFLAGHDYQNAALVLNKYLAIERRRRRPLALVALAETLLAQGRAEEALAPLGECLADHPHDAACFRARLLASAAHLNLGHTAEAEQELLLNLDDGRLAPASSEWRDSLFALGELLARTGRHNLAVARLEEAVARYPQDPRALQARFLAAVALASEADAVDHESEGDHALGDRAADRGTAQQLLERALAHYERLSQELAHRQSQRGLEAGDRSMQRNCDFSRGATLVRLGRYDEALLIYSQITSRYQREPQVLEAYLQIYACYRRLDRPSEAATAVAQAKVVLSQLDGDSPFTKVTNYSRPEWAELLDSLAAR